MAQDRRRDESAIMRNGKRGGVKTDMKLDACSCRDSAVRRGPATPRYRDDERRGHDGSRPQSASRGLGGIDLSREVTSRRATSRSQGGGLVWMRIEYKFPQSPLAHKSAFSHDDWNCKLTTFDGGCYLQVETCKRQGKPPTSRSCPTWEKSAGQRGEALLDFAAAQEFTLS